MPIAHESHEASLQVRVHINVWFIENHRFMDFGPAQKPNHLKPHLKAMSHPRNLSSEVMVLDIQREKNRIRDIPRRFKASNPQAGPSFFSSLFEGWELFFQEKKLIPKMQRR